MAEVRARLGTGCAHCGLAVPPERRAIGSAPAFCCGGCETAHGILRAGGLAQYYALGERRAAPVRPTGRSYDEFDHAAFEELYVSRRADGLATAELYLEGVHCASCVWLVERVPLLEAGIARAELDVRRSLLRVEWDPRAVPLSRIAQVLDRLGYPPHPFHGVAREAMRRREDRAALVRIGVAGALAGNVMLIAFALYAGDLQGMAPGERQMFRWVSLVLTLPALLFPGRVFFTGAWAALRTRALHMDLPIALALAAASVRGALNTITDSGPVYFDGVTLLVFLLLVGRYLQQRGQRAATDAAELLLSLTPRMARVRQDDGALRDVPTEALLPGMLVEVGAGQVFPADGTVVHGESSVNRALLTGESVPVVVVPGDVVAAGSENVGAPVRVRVDAAGSASRLARLLAEVEANARRRAPVVALANRLAGVFVALVLLLAAVTFLLWVGRDTALAWDHAIALLIVTCPCALALATPLAVSVAVGRAARAGIYIKGGDALELLARPGIMVLDKTGTVTAGRHDLVAWDGDPRWRPVILALEEGAAHPVAEGFRRAWPDLAPASLEGVRHDVLGGVSGRWDGREVAIGSPAFVASHGAEITGWRERLAGAAVTPVLLAIDGQVVAVAGFGDPVRDGARDALDALRARGWQTHLLSGDDTAVVTAVADALGFAAHQVIARATPEEKLARIRALRAGAGVRAVVMVGDGVNDAAAMTAAHVGVGVHGGAEASLLVADVHLTAPGLAPLQRLVEGATRTLGLIRRNMLWAVGYNAVGVALAMSGRLSPLVAAILMPVSSLTVVLGSWLGRSFVAAPVATTAASPATRHRRAA
ncbi:MAG: heavy metal translocating P-type ATPase metal-binding domain-containing protein [Gemmatimonadales bacterium]|nr:heavy metal translocating P-type ATPase metal-binding domain-containing protein [Gemmatimonadales bacterium]